MWNEKFELADTAQKMKFSIKDFSKCDQIRRKRHFLCGVTNHILYQILKIILSIL